MKGLDFKKDFKPVNLVSQIADFIEEAILGGTLEMGQQLVENEIAEMFSASRPPIREAFRVLESKHLVTVVPRKGAFVKEINPKDFESFFPVRAVLDGLAGRLAYSSMTKEDTDRMTLSLNGMEKSVVKKDVKGFRDFHDGFHAIINNATKNEILINFLSLLRSQHSWFVLSSLDYFKENYEESLELHKRILKAFIMKDLSEEELEKLLRDHVLVSLYYYRQNWPNRKG